MPSRPRISYSDLRCELEEARWLLRQTQAKLAALEAVEPNDIAVQNALSYARGLGQSSPDRVPLRILAEAVTAGRRENRVLVRMLRERGETRTIADGGE